MITIGGSASNTPYSTTTKSGTNHTRQLIAYLDLLGVSDWLNKIQKEEGDLYQKVKSKFDPYLETVKHWHYSLINIVSIYITGDAAIVVPKVNPEEGDSLSPQEFTEKLCSLWFNLVSLSESYSPKILITRANYQTIWCEDKDYVSKLGFRPNLYFAGGTAALLLHNTDESLPLPSGIYSDQLDLESLSFCRLKDKMSSEGWFSIDIGQILKRDLKEVQKIKAIEYREYKAQKDTGYSNAETIINALEVLKV